jgi:hypothetical protein
MKSFRKVKTTGVVFLFLFFALALTLFAFFRLSPVYEGATGAIVNNTASKFTEVDCSKITNPEEKKACNCANKAGFDYRKGPQRELSPQERQSLNQCISAANPNTASKFAEVDCSKITNPEEKKACNCANKAGFDYRKGPQRALSPQEMQSWNDCKSAKDTPKDPYYLRRGPCSLFKYDPKEYEKCKKYCESSFQPGSIEFGKCIF